MGRLTGKTAIVTGAGQGIGRGIALAFAKEGARVVVADVNALTAYAVADEIRRLGTSAIVVICDVSKEDHVKDMVAQAAKEFGTVDILVNNAQAWGQFAPIEDLNEASWNVNFDTGPKATWFCCKAVFPYMKVAGGKIINFASDASLRGAETRAAYAAAKEAIRGFSRVAAREWGKYKINVNIVMPAAASPASVEYQQQFPDQAKKRLEEKSIPRWGDPEKDIGRAVVFLASEDSDYITGQTLMVSGGNFFL